MNKKLCGYLILATSIFIIDRITKLAALTWCAKNMYVVNKFLSFDLLLNRGISWGMFHESGNGVYIIVSAIIAMITALLCWYAYCHYSRGNSILGEICIIAGSLCNLLDRILYPGVIDFILLSYGDLSWPVFNIADVMIVCGVGIVLFRYEK